MKAVSIQKFLPSKPWLGRIFGRSNLSLFVLPGCQPQVGLQISVEESTLKAKNELCWTTNFVKCKAAEKKQVKSNDFLIRWLFLESAIRFSNLQISKKKYSKKTILSLKFKFPANNSKMFLAGNLNFKFRIVFWNIFF